MQPQVRDLQALIAEQKQAIAPQQQLINESIAQNEASGTAQIMGLNAAKAGAFQNIEQGAQNKGMYFSGFAPDAQAGYIGSTYLPEMARLQQTIAQNRNSLLGKSADLYSNVYDKAINIRENDMRILNDWNQMTAQQQFNASEADKQRVFEAQQNQARINADAANTRASIAAQKTNAIGEATNSIQALLENKQGSDGYVSPSDFQRGRSVWVAAGGDSDQYTLSFGKFINPRYRQEYDYGSYLDQVE